MLNIGRSGSLGFIKACQHITNYSSGHETRSWQIGSARLDYPENHIEADNNLSWMLGSLDNRFGDDAIYVHLIRDRADVVASWNRLWNHSFSNLRCYTEGMLGRIPDLLTDDEKLIVVQQFCESQTQEIELFLRDKTDVTRISLDQVELGFAQFWNRIGAEGELENALQEFNINHHANLTNLETARKDRVYQLQIKQQIFNKRLAMESSLIEKCLLRIDRLTVKVRLFLLRRR